MNIYCIRKDYNYKDVYYAKDTDWESISCPVDEGHQRAGNRIGELKIELNKKQFGDFLWTALLSELIITDKVAELFKKNNITGYNLKKVIAANNYMTPKLWEFLITGWGGIALPETGIHLKESCQYCGHMVYSSFDHPEYLFDEKQWDKSDIFMIWPLPRFIFITEKVADLVNDNKLTGIKIIPYQQLEVDELVKTLSPGRLSMWMSEKRAAEIGKSLSIY